MRWDAGPHAHPAHRRVRRSHERVGAEVVVQERRLCPLQKHRLPPAYSPSQERPRVRHHWLQKPPEGEEVGSKLVGFVGLLVVDVSDHGVLLAQGRLKLLLKYAFIEDVLDPDTYPRNLVLVGGSDAAVGGADLGLTQSLLAVPVQVYVVRQDQVHPTIHLEAAPNLDPAPLQRRDLLVQDLRVHHDTVADGAHHALAHYPRGDQVYHELLLADPYRVPRVVPARVAGHVPRVSRQGVANPALTLVPP